MAWAAAVAALASPAPQEAGPRALPGPWALAVLVASLLALPSPWPPTNLAVALEVA